MEDKTTLDMIWKWFIHAFLWLKSPNNTNATRGKEQHQRAGIIYML